MARNPTQITPNILDMMRAHCPSGTLSHEQLIQLAFDGASHAMNVLMKRCTTNAILPPVRDAQALIHRMAMETAIHMTFHIYAAVKAGIEVEDPSQIDHGMISDIIKKAAERDGIEMLVAQSEEEPR
jgi:hypothetical protein